MMGRFAGPAMHGGGGFGNNMMQGGGFGIEGLIISALHLGFWVVIIILAFRLIKHYFPQAPWNVSSKDQALDILRQRYAKGEIDTEEYNLRKKELEI
jgi:putative membrane protein